MQLRDGRWRASFEDAWDCYGDGETMLEAIGALVFNYRARFNVQDIRRDFLAAPSRAGTRLARA